MRGISIAVLSTATAAAAQATANTTLLTDINVIKNYWGEVSPYSDNGPRYFGVQDIGLPDGCQIEQVHNLERHGARFPTGGFDDGENDEDFAMKVTNWTSGVNSSMKFTGPLAFLNGYQYTMGRSLLVGEGASQSFEAGVTFWQRYGRTLYNATQGQLAYNASFANGTARPKPVLRTTDGSRIENSLINWALGFFGPSYTPVPSPNVTGAGDAYDLVIIPEIGDENNTLAAYDSCFNDQIYEIGYLGDFKLLDYITLYLPNATARLQQYAPEGFIFSVNDTYAMQSICSYETSYLGYSDFCKLFTQDEWAGYEYTTDLQYYYDYGFGQPTGRAQGIGYLQELIARLTNQYITVSNSSVNSTLTNNPQDFPVGQKFYSDFTHDDIIISVLTAMSLGYLHQPLPIMEYPPNPNRHFILSHLTPFASRLITEVIGCSSANPAPVHSHRQYYTPTQYGYNPTNATYKFIRMRLNNGILPLSTIEGGACGNRTDGLCSMSSFLESQKDAYAKSNYNYACFGNYTIDKFPDGFDFNGAIFANTTTTA